MNELVPMWCDCDHLRMEPGAPLYQRDRVYLASQVDAVLAVVEQERDEWHRDASSHLQALCEKQAEVTGLEAQITAINEAML